MKASEKPSPKAPAAPVRPPWWGQYTPIAGGRQRLSVRWSRLLIAAGSLVLVCYLSLVTALWGYYSHYRKIPGVNWIDIAVLPRFSRVQAAIGAHYFANAQELWNKGSYAQSIFTARAAVLKSPRNLDARLFLADCWRKAGRSEEAIRTLRDGLDFSAEDPRFQKAIVGLCLATSHDADLVKLLRTDLPAHGVRLLERPDPSYKIDEISAVLNTEGPEAAQAILARYPQLAEAPDAAPILARMDWKLGHKQEALERLHAARERAPNNPAVEDAYIDTALQLGRVDEAKAASEVFRQQFPNAVESQLRYLEARADRLGDERRAWLTACLRFMVEFRRDPEALSRLGSLAASKGWTDVAYLLYQYNLAQNLSGFPFVVFYVGSLAKAGDYAMADEVWHELSNRNSAQLMPATYLSAIIAWGAGRQSEALQIADRLRLETENDPSRRAKLEDLFRSFQFAEIADELTRAQ
jgi:tetratricopeptide (TPR) repeat protein